MDNQLTKIEELVKLYVQTGNRMVLSNLRAHVTSLTHQNPCIFRRLAEIFEQNQLSMSVL